MPTFSQNTTAVTIRQIKKSYHETEALKGIDLSIAEGEFFGLLGPNGAGKTTLINAMVGLVKPSGGSIQIFGCDAAQNPVAAKRHVGLAPQEINMNTFFSIRKVLEFQGGFFGLRWNEAKQRAEELLKKFGLWEKRKEGRHHLSGGMQRRLLIARALMGKPKLLILDEPTAGIDVELRHELWELLLELNKSGTTILLTTHYIEEAEFLCRRIGIINEGRLIACDTPKRLIETCVLNETDRQQGRLRYTRPGTLEEVFVALTGKRMTQGGECKTA